MYTEEEAKTKWCPMVRKLAYSGSNSFPVSGVACSITSFNRLKTENTNCTASGCMMWRFDSKEMYQERNGTISDRNLTDTGKWIKTGYCGLVK